ncbi:MAG: hypothetical protein LBS88_09745 [Tannerellaceae bacterium]|nr:hypothetical protein [Tannerellaceae bacterium]
MSVIIWISLCLCSSCGTLKQHTTASEEYSSSLQRMDSLVFETRETGVVDMIRRGELKAHINIRTFSAPDSTGQQYLLSETDIKLSMSDEAEEHEEAAKNGVLTAGSLQTDAKSASKTAEETKDIDRRPFRIPGWVWWVAGLIGVGFIVFKVKDWIKRFV